jgi:hypothetical protein
MSAAALTDEESAALVMASFDDRLLKLTSLHDVCRFVREQLAAVRGSSDAATASGTASTSTSTSTSSSLNLALLSTVLGELEEVQRQENTLPLTTFFHTHAAFEQFVARELAPVVAALRGTGTRLLYLARRALADRSMVGGRKRKFACASGHVWHFVNTDLCTEFCFVVVVLCAAAALGIPNVYAVLSESHCWLGYTPDADDVRAQRNDDTAAALPASAPTDTAADATTTTTTTTTTGVPPVSALRFIDILPPDRSHEHAVSAMAESRIGWAYQRDARGVDRAVVLTPAQLIATMLVNVELTPDVKLPLLCEVPEDVALSLPGFVLAQAMCYHACGDLTHAALLYDCAVNNAVTRFGDALVYPLLQRAEFRLSTGQFADALLDFVEMARVIRSYSLLETDAELLDEATVAAAHVCDNVLPALVDANGDDAALLRAHFGTTMQLYDHLIAWIEAANLDPGVAWLTAVSLAIASHFPAVSRVGFGAQLLEQCAAAIAAAPDMTRERCVERLYASRVMRALALRLVALAANERSGDLVVRDVVEIFRQCARHPAPQLSVAVEPPIDQLADVFAQAVNEPWRAASEDARIRQALAEAANGQAHYNHRSGVVRAWPANDHYVAAAVPVPNGGAAKPRVRRRSDPTGDRPPRASAADAGKAQAKRSRDNSGGGTVSRENSAADAAAFAAPKPRKKAPPKAAAAPPPANGAASPLPPLKQASSRKAATIAKAMLLDDDASSGDELVEWTQCERCDRWAELAPGVSAASLPSQWFCEMNTWATNPDERQCPKLLARNNGAIDEDDNDDEGPEE